MKNVFVYGTLRKGYGNNRLLTNATFLGKAKTNEKYGMFGGIIPFVNKRSNSYQITGEVYSVTDDELARLDALEGHPDWYYRETIDVTLEENGEVIKADIYFNDYKDNPFPTGDYVENLAIRQSEKQTSYT